jgi:hypothetical protein
LLEEQLRLQKMIQYGDKRGVPNGPMNCFQLMKGLSRAAGSQHNLRQMKRLYLG